MTVIYSSVINKLFLVTFKLLLAMGINPLGPERSRDGIRI